MATFRTVVGRRDACGPDAQSERSFASRGQSIRRAALLTGWPVVLAMSAAACRSDHHVSPWPEGIEMRSLLPGSDLNAQLARVAADMEHEGLERTAELKGTFSTGEPFVIQGYGGMDATRRPRYAVRVATGRSVVLALGPRDLSEPPSHARTRLVVSLAGDGAWRSGTDLNGDGLPDVVAAGDDGTVEVWSLMPTGATRYPVVAVVQPTEAVDADGDGIPELAGVAHVGGEDAIAPHMVEVVGFAAGAYRYDAASARAYHARELRELAARSAQDAGAKASMQEQLGVALERAWHRIRAGQPAAKALEEVDDVARAHAPLPEGMLQAWIRWRGWLQDSSR